MNERKQQQIKIAHILKDLGLEDDLIEKMTSLKKEEIDKIYQTLIQAKTKLSTRKHVSNIQNTKKDLINEICPRCQAKLVLKTGQYGEFYGCSNFPKCKFKINKEKLDHLKQEKIHK